MKPNGAAVLLIVLFGVLVLVAAFDASPPAGQSQSRVQIEVVYPGRWQGAYGDVGVSGSILSWNGTGTRVVSLTRPLGSHVWIVSSNAQKLDASNGLLWVIILAQNGTILVQANTTAPYGVAQIEYEVN
jgi:hypothetical protein